MTDEADGVSVVSRSASEATSSVMLTVACRSPSSRCGMPGVTYARVAVKCSTGSSVVSWAMAMACSCSATQRNWPSTLIRAKSLRAIVPVADRAA